MTLNTGDTHFEGTVDVAALSVNGTAIDGTADVKLTDLTATAAEINAVCDDATVTAAELNDLDRSAMGTKVLVTTGKVNTTTTNINTGSIAAGPILVGVAGKQFVPTGVKMRALGGNASAATLVRLVEETSGTVIYSTAIANLVANVWVEASVPYTNGATLGTSLGVAGTAAKGIYIDKTGSSLATATSVDVILDGYWV